MATHKCFPCPGHRTEERRHQGGVIKTASSCRNRNSKRYSSAALIFLCRSLPSGNHPSTSFILASKSPTTELYSPYPPYLRTNQRNHQSVMNWCLAIPSCRHKKSPYTVVWAVHCTRCPSKGVNGWIQPVLCLPSSAPRGKGPL